MPSPISASNFSKQFAGLIASLRSRIEAEVEGFASDKAQISVRRLRADADFEYFCRTYFPHYIKHANAALHDYLYSKLPEAVLPSNQKTGAHIAIAAPRGNAKKHHCYSVIYLVVRADGSQKIYCHSDGCV